MKVRTRYRYSWGEDRDISLGDKTCEDKSKLEIIMVRWRLRSSLLGDKIGERKNKLQIIMVGWRLRSSPFGAKQAKERASYR